VMTKATMRPAGVRAMDRFIDTIEWLAAAFVGIVAADIFISVLLRYFFSVSIPDSYDFGKLLLGILIFWGIAATSYRGSHSPSIWCGQRSGPAANG
jgi:TRAP-type C4-dicarboxylate transport system permease small subunit